MNCPALDERDTGKSNAHPTDGDTKSYAAKSVVTSDRLTGGGDSFFGVEKKVGRR
jgi:hypothetical protein